METSGFMQIPLSLELCFLTTFNDDRLELIDLLGLQLLTVRLQILEVEVVAPSGFVEIRPPEACSLERILQHFAIVQKTVTPGLKEVVNYKDIPAFLNIQP